MKKRVIFDVLVVYTESLALSASGGNDSKTPFKIGSKSESYNNVYGYFLEICKNKGLKVGFSTSADVIGNGLCRSYWSYKNKTWLKHDTVCFSSLIFDKFSPTKTGIARSRNLLFGSKEILPFNDSELFEVFFDKLRTYEVLSDFSIPTVSITGYLLEDVEVACRELGRMLEKVEIKKNDFENEIVMKDRFGAGGRNVYKFKVGECDRMQRVIRRHKKTSFVIQPFVKFDKGFSYKNVISSTDIRLVFLGGKMVQSYIRVAKQNDFRCNEHQGGLLTYVSKKEIPEKLIMKANLLSEMLDKKDSLYALDFIVTNNGNPYLLEGNTGPGLDWNEALKKNELEAKKLIRLVVAELSLRVERSSLRIKKRFGEILDLPYTIAV